MKSEAQIKIDKELEEALDNLGGLLGHLTLCHARAIGTDRVGKVNILLGEEQIASFEMLPFVQDLGRVVANADLSAERADHHLEELEKARLEERVACLGIVEYLRSLPATTVLKDGALEKVRQMIEERGLPKEPK
jgi:hypothetical protein